MYHNCLRVALGSILLCQVLAAWVRYDTGDHGIPRRYRGVNLPERLESSGVFGGPLNPNAEATNQTSKTEAHGTTADTNEDEGVQVGDDDGPGSMPDTSDNTWNRRIIIKGPGRPQPTIMNEYLKIGKYATGFTLGGKPFRVVGINIYWLCNDENLPGVAKGHPTQKGRVREALAAAVAMGANTVRIGSCGISLGYPDALQPSLHERALKGSPALDIHDYAIYAAGRYGLKVILPLMDNYRYYHGGKYTILDWLGISDEHNGANFFTDPRAIEAFKDYIQFVLTRKNYYNGRMYGMDPVISIIEDGNEFGAYKGSEGYPPLAFTEKIAAQVKRFAPQALFMDGTDGFLNLSTRVTWAPGLRSKVVDIVTDHPYPRDIPMLHHQALLSLLSKKAFILGELDWVPSAPGQNLPPGREEPSLSTYLHVLDRYPNIGVMAWSLFVHTEDCRDWVRHHDGYEMYYPFPQDTPGKQANVLTLVQWFYARTGRPVPSQLPYQACPQEVF